MIEHICGGRRRRLRLRHATPGWLPIEGTPWRPARPAPPAPWRMAVVSVAGVLVAVLLVGLIVFGALQ